MPRLRRRRAVAPIARNLTPLRASGISAMMIRALKMIAEMIALFGVPRCMMLSAFSGPRAPGFVACVAHVGLRKCRRIVRAVAGHLDHAALRVPSLDYPHLRRGGCFSQEV